jgi:hypothetical protein
MFIFYYRSSFLWDVVCSERIILIAGISCSLKLDETVNSVLNILLIRVFALKVGKKFFVPVS